MRRRRSVTVVAPAHLFLMCVPLVSVFSMTGCVVKSSQLQELNYLLNENGAELKPYEWQLYWNQYEKAVYSVDINRVYVFGNIFGDSITIKNFNLLEAQGLGRFNYLWQFIEKDGYIMAYESGQLQATYQCSGWNPTEITSQEFIGAIQNCVSTDGRAYRNTIRLNVDGSISEITYDLFGENSSLVLKKN